MKKYVSIRNKFYGFSLPELLVVLVIIGILVLVAIPNLMPLISRAKATEAQQLTFLHSLEQYFISQTLTTLSALSMRRSIWTAGFDSSERQLKYSAAMALMPNAFLILSMWHIQILSNDKPCQLLIVGVFN